MTKNKTTIVEIEVLRGLAILFVLVSHNRTALWWRTPTFENYLNFSFGVDLFFCVSGFVITRAFYNDLRGAAGKDWASYWFAVANFWIRRAFRIMPLAWLWLLIPIVTSVVYNRYGYFFTFSGNVGDFLSAALNVYNFHYAACAVSPNVWCGSSGVYWSLSVEEQFYLGFPLLVLLPGRAMALALATIIAWMATRDLTTLRWMTRFDAISLGVLIAMFKGSAVDVVFAPHFLKNPLARWTTFFLLTLMLASAGGGPGLVSFFPILITIVCGAFVYIASFDSGYLIGPTPARAILVWIGERSFGLYLMHNPVIAFVHETWDRLHPGKVPTDTMKTVIVMAILGLLALLSSVSLRYFEMPLRRYGKSIADKRQAHGAENLTNQRSAPLDAAVADEITLMDHRVAAAAKHAIYRVRTRI